MRTLIFAMQSAGGSYATFRLGQSHRQITIPGIFTDELPPKELLDESLHHHILLKQTIGTKHLIEEQIKAFQPTTIILLTRNIFDIAASLSQKDWKDTSGKMEDKINYYKHILHQKLGLFHQIISYERLLLQKLPKIQYSREDILQYNTKVSKWCRENYNKKWNFGELKDLDNTIPEV